MVCDIRPVFMVNVGVDEAQRVRCAGDTRKKP